MYELCGRTKPGGGKCESPALKGKSFCFNHDPRRLRAARAVKIRYFLELPLLEHKGAIQAAITEVTRALGWKEIDCELGGRLLYALQLASTGKQLGTPPVNPVLAPPPEDRSRPRLRKNLRHRKAAGKPRHRRHFNRETELLPRRPAKSRSTSPGSGLISRVCGQMRQRAENTALSQMGVPEVAGGGEPFRYLSPASLHCQSCRAADTARSRSNRGAARTHSSRQTCAGDRGNRVVAGGPGRRGSDDLRGVVRVGCSRHKLLRAAGRDGRSGGGNRNRCNGRRRLIADRQVGR